MNNTNTTLFGGRLATVTFLDGRTDEITVRQLPLRDYEKAFNILDDELALTALICGMDKAWLTGTKEDGSDGLQPESYEALRAAAQEVNGKGFFAWSQRRAERVQAQLLQNAGLLAALPPEAVQKAMDASNPSRPSSPGSAPRPR
jgi:hypothetical protein